MFIGLMPLAVGVISLLVKLDVLSGSIWSYTWPAILIILGLFFLTRRFRWRSRWHRWCYPKREENDDRKES